MFYYGRGTPVDSNTNQTELMSNLKQICRRVGVSERWPGFGRAVFVSLFFSLSLSLARSAAGFRSVCLSVCMSLALSLSSLTPSRPQADELACAGDDRVSGEPCHPPQIKLNSHSTSIRFKTNRPSNRFKLKTTKPSNREKQTGRRVGVSGR